MTSGGAPPHVASCLATREGEKEELLQPAEQPAQPRHTNSERISGRTMEETVKGAQQQSDSVPEMGEDAMIAVGPNPPPPTLTEEERQELQDELVKVEDEIQTLSQVLAAKEKHMAEIKRKLGITPLNELKQNITKTWQEVTTSSAYRRTSETISHASLKATAAFSNVGSAISKKLEDVSMRSLQHSTSMPVMRNAPTFKSLEGKMETLKTKMSPSAPTDNPSNQDSGSPESSLSVPEGSATQETPRN